MDPNIRCPKKAVKINHSPRCVLLESYGIVKHGCDLGDSIVLEYCLLDP